MLGGGLLWVSDGDGLPSKPNEYFPVIWNLQILRGVC